MSRCICTFEYGDQRACPMHGEPASGTGFSMNDRPRSTVEETEPREPVGAMGMTHLSLGIAALEVALDVNRAPYLRPDEIVAVLAALRTSERQQQGCEQWRPVVGYEGKYEVSDLGNVRKVGKPVGQFKNSHGYRRVKLSGPRKDFFVHRLVALAFVPNPNGLPGVNHLNNDRADNQARNLEWCTQAQNLDHARRQGRMQEDYWLGKRSPAAKLDDETVRRIREAYADSDGPSYSALAKHFGVSKRTIQRVVRTEYYANV